MEVKFNSLTDEKLGKMIICMALDDNTESTYYKALIEEAKRRSTK